MAEYVACRHCGSQARLKDGISTCDVCGWGFYHDEIEQLEAQRRRWAEAERARIDARNRAYATRVREQIERLEAIQREADRRIRSEAAVAGWRTRRENARKQREGAFSDRIWSEIREAANA